MNLKKIEKILINNQFKFINFKTTNSTMDEAKKYLKDFQSNLVVLTDQQTAGRGRRGNKWISPPGNIYCSIVISNSFSLNEYFIFSMLTLVSVKKTLEEFGFYKTKFKWPNDIFFNNKKFGGIILEPLKINMKNFAIIGLGINFISSPIVNSYHTTYLKEFININNKFFFLEKFFDKIFFYLNNVYNIKKHINEEFTNSLMFLNKKIVIDSNNKKLSGIFKGINDDGSLVLYSEKKRISIYSGNIVI